MRKEISLSDMFWQGDFSVFRGKKTLCNGSIDIIILSKPTRKKERGAFCMAWKEAVPH